MGFIDILPGSGKFDNQGGSARVIRCGEYFFSSSYFALGPEGAIVHPDSATDQMAYCWQLFQNSVGQLGLEATQLLVVTLSATSRKDTHLALERLRFLLQEQTPTLNVRICSELFFERARVQLEVVFTEATS